MSAGVLQGSALSPLLYSIYLDPLVESLRYHGPSVDIPGSQIHLIALLYADDIALIASSCFDLARLLRLAEEDSLLRGYRFSPTKGVIVSNKSFTHRLYEAVLPRQRNFCYLGIELCTLGIDPGSYTSARIQKTEKAAERLRAAGARFSNFPSFVNIQLYAAFIRPGLEYGVQLTSHHKASMYRLQQCQKSIVCSFLGVHFNERNDVIEAISYCPPGVMIIEGSVQFDKNIFC